MPKHRLSTLGPDGKWPDSEVDYTTGCTARRANWPAQTHWQRIRKDPILLYLKRRSTYQFNLAK